MFSSGKESEKYFNLIRIIVMISFYEGFSTLHYSIIYFKGIYLIEIIIMTINLINYIF